MIDLSNVKLELYRGHDGVLTFELEALVVKQGELLALTGPSGCGKTTLVRLLAGLQLVDKGDVVVLGKDLQSMPESKRDGWRGQHIGYVPQQHGLLDGFTAHENVLLGLRFGRKFPQGEFAELGFKALEEVGLGDKAHVRPDGFSVGERQRVALARALVNKPELLLADEPTGSLDPPTARKMFDLLVKQAEKHHAALLMVTHDLALAERLPRRFGCEGLVSLKEEEVAS